MKKTIAPLMALLMIISLFGCNKPAQPLVAADYLVLGEKYLLELDYEQALVQFLKVIEIDPMEPRGYTGAAEAYVGLERYDRAMAALQKGLNRLSDSRSYLRAAARIYEDIIKKDPSNEDAYIELAEIYRMLGDDERADETLRLGGGLPPDAIRTKEPPAGAVIPEYEIRQTLYQEIRADDGILLARNEYHQPVFTGDIASAKRMNESFENDLAGVSVDGFGYLPEMYNNHEGYVYDEAQYGRVGGYVETWSESFRLNEYISFAATGDWDGLGPHGGFEMLGRTFDTSSGEILSVADILTIPPDQIQETLYSEYIAYHRMLGDGFDEMARGYGYGSYDRYLVESVKGQCGENAIFWLADDGVHIFFDQYTYDYATGASELVIPFTRFDLIRSPFAVHPVGWKASYNALLDIYSQQIADFSSWGFDDENIAGKVIVTDYFDDRTPELVFVGCENVNYRYSMKIWSYDDSLKSPKFIQNLNSIDIGSMCFLAFVTEDGFFWTHHTSGDGTTWWMKFKIEDDGTFSYRARLDERWEYIVDTEELFDHYTYWEYDVDTGDSYEYSRAEFEAMIRELLITVTQVWFDNYFGEPPYLWERHGFNRNLLPAASAMTFKEAEAYLNR